MNGNKIGNRETEQIDLKAGLLQAIMAGEGPAPCGLTTAKAISRLRAAGNWPALATMTREQAECDYVVVAAFWGQPDALAAYLQVKGNARRGVRAVRALGEGSMKRGMALTLAKERDRSVMLEFGKDGFAVRTTYPRRPAMNSRVPLTDEQVLALAADCEKLTLKWCDQLLPAATAANVQPV